MTLSEFRATFFDRYSSHSYEIQQKAYLLFWGCIWACVLTIPSLGYAFYAYYLKSDPVAFKYIFVLVGLILITSLGVYLIWRNKFQVTCYIVLLSINFVFMINYNLSMGRFYETGIFTHREYFYMVLAYTALFHSKRIFFVVATILLIWPLPIPLIYKPNFDPTTAHHITTALFNGVTSFITVSMLLYFGSLINRNSLDTAEKEIAINKALNSDLDLKVKERTQKLKEKNDILKGIENSLKKYLPKQLVETITTGRQEAIEAVTNHHRKKLTFFFSDIKDFTKITDALEPEDMANLLNEYLTEMNIIINKYRGTLAQVVGDGLYVFFGAPERSNDRDHAVRSVKMAVEMQQKMMDLNKRWFDRGVDEILQIRCGINTGMATVGGYGSYERKEYTIRNERG